MAAVLEEVAARAEQGKEQKEAKEAAKELVPSAPVPKVNRQDTGETGGNLGSPIYPTSLKPLINTKHCDSVKRPLLHTVPPVPCLCAPVPAGEDQSQGEREEGQGDVSGQGGGGTSQHQPHQLYHHLLVTGEDKASEASARNSKNREGRFRL